MQQKVFGHQVAQHTVLLQKCQHCSELHGRVMLPPYTLVTNANIHTCQQKSLMHYMLISEGLHHLLLIIGQSLH